MLGNTTLRMRSQYFVLSSVLLRFVLSPHASHTTRTPTSSVALPCVLTVTQPPLVPRVSCNTLMMNYVTTASYTPSPM